MSGVVTNTPWLYALAGRGGSLTGPTGYYQGSPEALKRSWDLLLEHLDETQQRDLCQNGGFVVVAQDGQRVHIRADWSHINVHSVGNYARTWCTAPAERVPLWDHILSQLLAIKYNWAYFELKSRT